jgi:hypothetical protein
MDYGRVIRFLIRSAALAVMLVVLLAQPFQHLAANLIAAIVIFYVFIGSADWVYSRSASRASNEPSDPLITYDFPSFADEDIRAARIRSFIVGAIIAVLPAVFNASWRWFDDGIILGDRGFKQSMPDFAIAGVGITISAYTNTVFSIARLKGQSTIGPLTFSCLVVGALCALLCFLAYLRANHAPPAQSELSRMFYSALALATSSLIFSYAAVVSFVSDELRRARKLRTSLPTDTEQGEAGAGG